MNTTVLGGRWLFLALPALGMAGYAVAVLAIPTFGPPFIHERFAVMPWVVVGHIGGGAIALLTGALQVNARLRCFMDVHRWLGRLYVIAVAVGGLAGLILATRSQGGLVAHVGFGLLAVLWLGTTGIAYRQIRRGDQANHRRWMIRSYSLTFAAVTLRNYLPIALVAGLPFVAAYQAIAWACWVPNLLVVEWWLSRPATRTSPRMYSSPRSNQ